MQGTGQDYTSALLVMHRRASSLASAARLLLPMLCGRAPFVNITRRLLGLSSPLSTAFCLGTLERSLVERGHAVHILVP
jgi:hypothetical protein